MNRIINKINNRLAHFLNNHISFYIMLPLPYKVKEKYFKLPVPASHIYKEKTVEYYSKHYRCEILVETGTYLGEMVSAMEGKFSKIYSIEIVEELYCKNVEKFKNNSDINLCCGDSSKVLKTICEKCNKRTLFWLDGHYSGGITGKGEKECPIWEELDSIFRYMEVPFVILIDDARCFVGRQSYPTLEELKVYVTAKGKRMLVSNDIIRVY